MKRLLVFFVLLLVFVAVTFPHRRVVERLVGRRLAGVPVEISMGAVRPILWPLGYRIADVRLRSQGVTVSIDSADIALLFGSGMHARACGGTVDAAFTSPGDGKTADLDLAFAGLNFSSCVKGSPVSVTGAFGGEVHVAGFGDGNGSLLGRNTTRGSLVVEGNGGTLSGYLPAAPGAAVTSDPKPIGTWEFSHVAVRARLERGEVLVQDASADAEGVHWELSNGRLAPGSSGRTRLSAELKARIVADTPRAKAVLGILPRAGENPEGWRSYRLSGSLDAPRIVGLK